MNSADSKKWLNEYEAFLKVENQPVPQDVTEKVLSRMRSLTSPSAWNVFFKILGIHLTIGFLSLSICHQFGMNPFNTETSLDMWFMSKWGHSACMVFCGVLFLSISVLSAGYFLSVEEVKALKRTEFLQTLALSLISLTLFAFFGAELAVTISGLWLLGGLVGGCLAAEAIWKIKRIRFA